MKWFVNLIEDDSMFVKLCFLFFLFFAFVILPVTGIIHNFVHKECTESIIEVGNKHCPEGSKIGKTESINDKAYMHCTCSKNE